jgi:hypothetical protein
LEKDLERAAESTGAWWLATVQVGFANTMGGRSSDELWRLSGGENP